MTNEVIDLMSRLKKETSEVLHRVAEPLQTGGGGGNNGGMDDKISALEKRVDRFEAKVDGLSKDITDLRVQTATLAERVSHLPSKEFIFKGIAGLTAIMVAITTLAPKLQALVGITHP